MLRAMWTGSISFGLVSIPVKAVPAQVSKDLRFELLHEPCKTKVKTRRYCPHCEREVPDDEIARGYQYRKGDYVLLDEGDLENVTTPAKHTLQIMDFVDLKEVDPIYFEKPYYLQPAPGGERTYTLLREAMEKKGRVAVGKVAFREREHLAVVRPLEHALVLETIAFPDEVRALEEAVPEIDVKVDERELHMADLLIENLTGHFDPEKYTDDYRDELLRRVSAKVEGGTVKATAAPKAPAKGEVLDLMEVLRRSVEAAQGGRAAKEPAAAGNGKSGGSEKSGAKRTREKKAA